MPEPDSVRLSTPRSSRVTAGLGVEAITHVPVTQRELRFTRNRAGALLLAAGILLVVTAVFFQITGYDTITPYLPAPLPVMQATALLPALLCLYLGRYCLKYAALIITPLGVERLPFLHPRRNMQWFVWQQILSTETDGRMVTFRLRDATVHQISMSSMTMSSRTLLLHALKTRLELLDESGYGTA